MEIVDNPKFWKLASVPKNWPKLQIISIEWQHLPVGLYKGAPPPRTDVGDQLCLWVCQKTWSPKRGSLYQEFLVQPSVLLPIFCRTLVKLFPPPVDGYLDILPLFIHNIVDIKSFLTCIGAERYPSLLPHLLRIFDMRAVYIDELQYKLSRILVVFRHKLLWTPHRKACRSSCTTWSLVGLITGPIRKWQHILDENLIEKYKQNSLAIYKEYLLENGFLSKIMSQ